MALCQAVEGQKKPPGEWSLRRSNGMETIIVWNPASSYEVLGKARCDRAIGDTDDRMTRIKDLEVVQQLRTFLIMEAWGGMKMAVNSTPFKVCL